MSEFSTCLTTIIQSPPFSGNQAAFARAIDLNGGHLSRILKGERAATSQIVGKVCGVVDSDSAAKLLTAYLSDTLRSMHLEDDARPEDWSDPFERVDVQVSCKKRRR